MKQDYWDDDHFENRSMFQDPGGRSALRRSHRSNPRNLPCPTCGAPNRLTPADRRAGYQCDACADRACRDHGLHYYHQTDPRGCALYVSAEPLTDQNYSNAVACC